MDRTTNPDAFHDVMERATGSEPSASVKAENPKDGEGTPENKPVTEGTKSEPQGKEPENKGDDGKKGEEPNEPKEPEKKENSQEHDYKKRFDNTSTVLKETSEAYQRTISTNARLVEKNPEILETIAAEDPKLADEIVKKLHGKESYESFKTAQEIEKSKEDDPEGYEAKKRLQALEEKEAARARKAKESFYDSKGIKVNEFDPKYKKVEAELRKFNPDFVSDEPERAYELAHTLAFPEEKRTPEQEAEDVSNRHLSEQTGKTKGNVSAPWTGSPDKRGERSAESKDFGQKFKKLTR